MEQLCDLHTHSYYSDGTYSPAQLIEEAERLGLGAIALCDHNSVAGLPEFMEAAKGKNVEAVPGIEITTEYRETELHILGLQIAPCHYDRLTAMMEDLLIRKERSEQALIQALNRDGMDLSYEQIKAKTKGGYVNRAHIAVALVEKGYAPDFRSAFRMYLRPEMGYYEPPKRLDVLDTIAMLKSMDAAVVLAHPFLDLDEAGLREFLPKAKETGLDGMETLYPKYSPETTRLACQIADEFGILHSGGSDFHGSNKPDTQMGAGHGDLRIPCDLWRALSQRTSV